MNGDGNHTECRLVDTWLDDWNAGRADDIVAHRLETHVAVCERCQRLTAIVRGTGAQVSESEGESDADLLSAVLGQTTGSACARAETLLPALADDELDPDSRGILEGHVAHCASCAGLLAALREARSVLPAMAHVEPPPGFVAGVLRATTAAAPRSAIGDWWLRVMARPRASLELAYVATVLLVVLLGNPVAAFHQAEQHASRLVSAVPVARLARELPVKDAAAGTAARLLAPLGAAARAVATELSGRWGQARALIDEISMSVGHVLNWLATLDLGRIFGGGGKTAPRASPGH